MWTQKIKGQDISSGGEYTSLPSIIVKQKLWPSIHYIRKCCSLVELVKAPIIEVAATKPQPIQLLDRVEEKKKH